MAAHGSKKGNERMEALAAKVREITGIPAKVGYKRHGRPGIADAMRALSSEGADEIVVVPMFMSEGRYVSSVPRNVGLPAGTNRGTVIADGGTLDITVTRPVGFHPRMGDTALASVRTNADGPAGVVLVGHGSARDSATVRASARLFDAGYDVMVAESSDAEGLGMMVRTLRSRGTGRVVVVPVRFSGIGADIPSLGGDVVVIEPLGMLPGVADMVADMASDPEAWVRPRPAAPVSLRPVSTASS